MKYLYKKPYFYFWLISLIVLIISYKSYIEIGGSALDINIHDTYFVIAHYNFFILFAGIFAFIGIVYSILSKIKINLNKFLTNIHTIVSVGCVPVYFLGLLYFNNTHSGFPLFDNPTEGTFISAIIFVFILVQIIFIINLIISTTKHFFRKS